MDIKIRLEGDFMCMIHKVKPRVMCSRRLHIVAIILIRVTMGKLAMLSSKFTFTSKLFSGLFVKSA